MGLYDEYSYSIPENFEINDIDEYYLNAPIEILDIGMRNIRCIKRYKICTIRQLASMTVVDIIKIRYLGRRNVEKILKELEKIGIYPRREDEEKFLYGYPRYIKAILNRKDKYWTNLFFISTLIVNLDWMRYYRNSDFYNNEYLEYMFVYPDWSLLQQGSIEDVNSLLKLVNYVTDQVLKNVEQMANILKTPLQEALGDSDHSGDENKIVSIIEEMMICYRNLVFLRQKIKGYIYHEEYKHIEKKLCGVVEGVFKDIDNYYQKLINARQIILDINSGRICDQIPEIDLVLSFSGKKTEDLRIAIEEIRNNISLVKNQKITQNEDGSKDTEVEVLPNKDTNNDIVDIDLAQFFTEEDRQELESAIMTTIIEVIKKRIKVTVKVMG